MSLGKEGYSSQLLDAESVLELFVSSSEERAPNQLAVEKSLSYLAKHCECSLGSLRQEFSETTPGGEFDGARLGIALLHLVEFRTAIAEGILERCKPDQEILLALLRFVPECRKQVFAKINLSTLSKPQLTLGIEACKDYQRAFEAELWRRRPTLEEIEYLERLDHDDEALFFGGGGESAYLSSN